MYVFVDVLMCAECTDACLCTHGKWLQYGVFFVRQGSRHSCYPPCNWASNATLPRVGD